MPLAPVTQRVGACWGYHDGAVMSPDPRSGGVTALTNTFGLADAIIFALTVLAESGMLWLRRLPTTTPLHGQHADMPC